MIKIKGKKAAEDAVAAAIQAAIRQLSQEEAEDIVERHQLRK